MCNKGYGKSELCSPEGITFHPERSVLYIADTGNNRIQILEKDGTYLDSIGPKNKNTGDTVKFRKTGPSKLNQPTDVAVTIMHVIVADSGNHKIKVLLTQCSELVAYFEQIPEATPLPLETRRPSLRDTVCLRSVAIQKALTLVSRKPHQIDQSVVAARLWVAQRDGSAYSSGHREFVRVF
ncbi:Protein lin-41 [Acromyrmex echinatior]|uniref:Protein lin-41 n=1 Tax=Acromyrmex echinatior TaxID=103372 RepID=F4WA74_ACREC|nr:Protein lin-41 [Acromyrmex echinatior]